MFSMTKIENRKWQIGKDINFVTFRKFVTSLVQKLKILGKKLVCGQYLDLQILETPNILSFSTNNVSEGYTINVVLDFQFLS